MSLVKTRTESSSTPTRHYITNTHWQNVGDIYNPGHGRRLQIRNNHRQIIGYLERDGTITNSRRRPVAGIIVSSTYSCLDPRRQRRA